jgi:hypothetical protein
MTHRRQSARLKKRFIVHDSPSASRGSACAIAFYTWASRGETLVSTLAAQTGPPRSTRKAADAARVSIWPTAAALVRNSPRGWTPSSLTTIRLSGRRAVGRVWPTKPTDTAAVLARPFRLVEPLARHCAVSRGRCHRRAAIEHSTMAASQPSKRRCFFGSPRANLWVRESLRCPPSRRVPHKCSGRRPNRYTGRAAAFLVERGGPV